MEIWGSRGGEGAEKIKAVEAIRQFWGHGKERELRTQKSTCGNHGGYAVMGSSAPRGQYRAIRAIATTGISGLATLNQF